MATDLSNWDFYNSRVERDVSGGQFVSAESTLIAAGTPELSGNTGANASAVPAADSVYPIGLLESFGIQQSKQLQKIFEIGSSRAYFIPGRVIGALNLGRTYYFGPSLLRVLYAYYKADAAGDVQFTVDGAAELTLPNGQKIPNPKTPLIPGAQAVRINRNPGVGHFFIDLASDLFSLPIGLGVFFKDLQNNSLGAMYIEQCYVQGHQFSVSSGSVLIMEGASLQYDRIEPIEYLTA